jgi:hypothetical protein
MSATLDAVDAQTLEKVIAWATPAQRRYLVEKLLPRVVEDDGCLPRLVRDTKGELIGVLVPEFRPSKAEPPRLTDEEYAEIQRRIDTPSEHITHEQLLKDLGLADIPAPRRL